MKKRHSYQVMVTAVAEPGALGPSSEIVFTHHNHDDLAHIVTLVRESSGLDADASAALAIGLKLLGNVVLEHKTEPPFAALLSPLREFIAALKARRG